MNPAATSTQARNVTEEIIMPSQSEHDSDRRETPTSRSEGFQDGSNSLPYPLSSIEATTGPSKIVNETDHFFYLGQHLVRKFMVSGKLEEINQAIECHSRAIRFTSNTHPDYPEMLGYLGISLLSRFEHLGDIVDIDKAIASLSQAILIAPDGHAELLDWLNNLGISHQRRFHRLGDLADISKAIDLQYQVVSLTPNGHAVKPSGLSNLGNSLNIRFERQNDLADINKAIEYQSQAVLLTPDSHMDMPARLNNLGSSHLCRFDHLGDLADVDEAIECHSMAVLLTPDHHVNKPSRLTTLGASHAERFGHFGELADIDKAIEFQSEAVLLTPDNHVRKPTTLINLGNSHARRFKRYGDLADISKAIECQSKAVLLTPDGHADKPGKLNNLGISHQSRYDYLGDLADITRAIECQSQAVLLTPDDHARKPAMLLNLGNTYKSRFKRLGDQTDIDKTIEHQFQAALLIPDGHSGMTGVLNGLGHSHWLRFERFNDSSDISKMLVCLRRAAHCPTGKALTKFESALAWAQLSTRFDQSSVISAYQYAMDLIPQVVWIGSTVERRYEYTQEIGTFAVEAAAVAISGKEYELALEWLEAGRSIVWNQILQLRTQFDDLSTANADLATHFKEVASALEHASARGTDSSSDLEADAQNHRRLAKQYEDLLSRVRQLPDYNDFLRAKKALELLPAARSGPVIVVNAYEDHCDALILCPGTDEIKHLSLADISDAKLQDLQHQMKGCIPSGMQVRAFRKSPIATTDRLKGILGTLWRKIVEPVLDSLGYVVSICDSDSLCNISDHIYVGEYRRSCLWINSRTSHGVQPAL